MELLYIINIPNLIFPPKKNRLQVNPTVGEYFLPKRDMSIAIDALAAVTRRLACAGLETNAHTVKCHFDPLAPEQRPLGRVLVEDRVGVVDMDQHLAGA